MSAASSRDLYRALIAGIGDIEALGQWYVRPIRMTVEAAGRAETIFRVTEWPMAVFGLSAQAVSTTTGALQHDLVLIRLSDSQSENPYMDGFYSISSVIGREPAPRFMRLQKPLLLTENRGLRIEVRNTATESVEVEIALLGVRIYGNPVAGQSRI